MKVVQMLPALGVGGVERGVVELSRRLVAHNIKSIVIAKGGAAAAQVIKDGGEWIDFDGASKNPFSIPARILQLRKILVQQSPDIIHIRSRVPGWLCFFARRNLRAKIVSTMHGIYHTGFYSSVMTRTDAIICPSNAVWRYARDNYRAAESKMHLIHRGTDFDYFDPQKTDYAFCADFRAKYQLQNKRVALIAARISQLKGHAIFVRALAADKQLTGLIVGGGNAARQKRLLAFARRAGVAERLIFAGAQNNMREIYAIADITVSASTRPEAFGRTVAESLAMNTPVAACAHGGALDIVLDGVNGFLFAPGDSNALALAMQKALSLNNKDLRQSVLPMSLDAMFDKTLAVYQSLLTDL